MKNVQAMQNTSLTAPLIKDRCLICNVLKGITSRRQRVTRKREGDWGRRGFSSLMPRPVSSPDKPLYSVSKHTKTENGLSCHGWLSTKYSQFGSSRLCPPNSVASVCKAILYLESVVKQNSRVVINVIFPLFHCL